MLTVTPRSGFVELTGRNRFNPIHTFECGQCFRWRPQADGSYLGVAFGQAARIWEDGDHLCISGTLDDYERVWRGYFDLDRDYEALDRLMPEVDILQQSLSFGRGLHILAQEPWEALCTFILSQCNNIPRIRTMTEALCSRFGEPVDYEGCTLYAFPSPERIAALSLDALAPIRAGYRSKYLLSAARRIVDGFDLDSLRQADSKTAREQLLSFDGVGIKVADCMLLFGLGKLDAFPVDTWIKKALFIYSEQINPADFGNYAGIVQQYLFYYARSMKIGK